MAILPCKWMIAIMAFFFPLHPVPGTNTGIHPFYTSVTEINYNPSSKTLELSCRFFSNDLESCLEKINHTRVDVTNTAQKQAIDQMIMGYISTHLQIVINKKPLALQWVGRELETDASWVYLQASCPDLPRQATVINSLLYDMFSSEINIIHITVNGDRKSERLSYPDKQTDFSFN